MRAPAARILHGPDLFTQDRVTLVVRDENGAYLMRDGTWFQAKEGESNLDAGLLLPASAIEAIAIAIQEYQGHASHAETEARVLREWLTAERARVDAVLSR